MKIIKGWKKLSHDCGYFNDVSGQTVVVLRKKFSNNYHTVLLELGQTKEDEGKIISPEYSTKTKADASAEDWMQKHPNGVV